MSNTAFRVGCYQSSCAIDRQTNFEYIQQAVADAARQQCQLLVLMELHNGPYFCQTQNPDFFELAEPIPGPTTRFLGELAAQHDIVIVGSVFEKRQSGVFHNTAIVMERDGSLAGMYRKMHIPEDPGYHEKFYFTPGDMDFTPIQTSVGRLGVLVCWDQWFPEAARLMALNGADMLIYPTAIGWDPSDDDDEQRRQLNAWKLVQRGHAVANGLPVLVANRCGAELHPETGNQVPFWGNSFIAGPQGEILAEFNQNQTGVLTANLDFSKRDAVRRIWPFFRDRRIDAYQDLLGRGV